MAASAFISKTYKEDQMAKIKYDKEEYIRQLENDIQFLRADLDDEFDEYKAEQLYVMEGEYKALINSCKSPTW